MEDSKPRWLWRRGEWALVGEVWGGWAQGGGGGASYGFEVS